MNKKLKEKVKEAFSSVLPISAIVLLLSILIVPLEIGTVVMFLAGAALLIVGMGFFSLGSDIAMMPMGEGLGAELSRSGKIGLISAAAFIMGAIITIAEPDLTVLANQVPSIPNPVLIGSVAAGVGIFLVLAVLRIILKISLPKLLIACYAGLFILSIFVPKDFISVAFDSGGVTTGPITVPFIMALGVGLAAMRGGKDASSDSFGLVALCSVGPILAVMLMGIFFNPQDAAYTAVQVPEVSTMRDVVREFAESLPHHFTEITTALAPILAAFVLMQLITRRFKRRELIRMVVGYLYTFIGLLLFMTGVNVGFLPVGSMLGSFLASASYRWLLVPLGMLIGYFIVAAEPAVHVLNKQVDDLTDGAISQRAMKRSLSIGVAISVGLAMIRVLTGVSIYWIIIPGYALALALTFFVPKIFVGIAFDSGGVASGPMTSTFLLPLAMGACEAFGGNVMTDAFGVVAMVAMTPLIAIQIMGVIYAQKLKRVEIVEAIPADIPDDDDIVEYEDENAPEYTTEFIDDVLLADYIETGDLDASPEAVEQDADEEQELSDSRG